MQARTAYKYFHAIDKIEAQELLLKLTVSDYPNMKKESREKIHKSFYNKAFPSKQISINELEGLLNG